MTNTRRVLVTGASGFIGSQTLSPLLEAGFETHAVTSGQVSRNGGATWHRTNLLDIEAVASLVEQVRPTHLLHLFHASQVQIFHA